ncbi:MAG: YihY family inner membrane protein [Methylotenera sp.]|nr:YihY family inner membrane protein [Oligoflexia bacterium]
MKLITKKTLQSVFADTWKQIQEAQLPQAASSLAYTTILSLIPLIAVSFSIFKAFGGLEKLYGIIEPYIIENLTEGASDDAITAVRNIIGNLHGGTLGVGGLIGLIVTSMSMLNSIEHAINRVWKAPLSRSLFHRISIYWFFITLGPVAISVAIGAATSTEFPISKFIPDAFGIFVITIFFFYGIYKYVPNRKVHWIPAATAAFVTSLLWNLARMGYFLYTKRMMTYDKIYGSLGAIPILLLWIYIAWLVILTGAAFSAALQRRFELNVPESIK